MSIVVMSEMERNVEMERTLSAKSRADWVDSDEDVRSSASWLDFEPVPEDRPTWSMHFYRLGTYAWVHYVFMFVGGGFAFFVPYFLTPFSSDFPSYYWIFLSIPSVIIYGLIVYGAHRWYLTSILRAARPRLWIQLLLWGVVGVLVVIISEYSKKTFNTIIGFIFLAVVVFCIMMIGQPVVDYGILSFFVLLPLQVAFSYYRRKFNWIYIPLVIFTLICIASQLYFVRYTDEKYAKKKAKQNHEFGWDILDNVV